ncbi:hypothetical protein BMS3Abin15_00442 [bacterium BMS3Abin15]|nr:hypothetical protein BMS3Abin15_00442 [bacterium BMS3Abin15]HDZ85055.1 hypothetical protein [Candidatus Moranbacteria bacterium]
MRIKAKILTFSFILVIFGLLIAPCAQASYWGEPIMAANLKQMMEKIYDQIQGMILGALKQAAVETINNSVNSLITSGGASGSLLISDPYDFIFGESRRTAVVSVDHFLNNLVRGRSSISNYSTGREGVRGNYYTYLAENAKRSIIPGSKPPCDIGDPHKMFDEGNWRSFNRFLMPHCNPSGVELMAQEFFYETEQANQRVAEARYRAGGGFRDVESGGQVTTPGSIIKDIQSQTQDVGNKILASAKSVPEVITAVVTKIITKTIKQGIGNAQRNIQKEISNTTGKLTSELRSKIPTEIFKPPF